MKMLEHVEEGLIRQRVEIDEMQCGFMLGCGTNNAIYEVLNCLQAPLHDLRLESI